MGLHDAGMTLPAKQLWRALQLRRQRFSALSGQATSIRSELASAAPCCPAAKFAMLKAAHPVRITCSSTCTLYFQHPGVQAMMELGATVCTQAPKCAECPIRAHCGAYAEVQQHISSGGSAASAPPVTRFPTKVSRLLHRVAQSRPLTRSCCRQAAVACSAEPL